MPNRLCTATLHRASNCSARQLKRQLKQQLKRHPIRHPINTEFTNHILIFSKHQHRKHAQPATLYLRSRNKLLNPVPKYLALSASCHSGTRWGMGRWFWEKVSRCHCVAQKVLARSRLAFDSWRASILLVMNCCFIC